MHHLLISCSRCSFAHNPGAIAGVVVGAVVALAAAAIWVFLAWRRHNTRKLEGAAIGPPSRSRMRPPLQDGDEDDEDDGLGGPVMAERMRGGAGSGPVALPFSHVDPRAPSGYGALMLPAAAKSSPGESDFLMVDEMDAHSSSEDVSGSQSHSAGHSNARYGASSSESSGGPSAPRRSIPTGSAIGFGQAAEEMNTVGVAISEPPRAISMSGSLRARDSSGLDPGAWLGGHVIAPVPRSPTAVSSGDGHAQSSQGHSGSSTEAIGFPLPHPSDGSGEADASPTLFHHSSSAQGHSSSSGHGHDKRSLASGEGRGSSEGHRTSGWFEAGSPNPPSSYPAKAPRTSTGGSELGRSPSQKSFFTRSLRWKRASLSQPASAMDSQVDITEGPRSPPGGSASTPNVPAFFSAFNRRRSGSNAPATWSSASSPPQSPRQTLFSGPPPPPATMRRLNNPGPMLHFAGASHQHGRPSIASLAGEVGEIEVEPHVPRQWPGLSPGLTLPPLPSPAITEGSGDVREGLLDPNIRGGHYGGMVSPSAVSLADHRDYTRPIGALVNNRMYSTTTVATRRTFDTQDSVDTATIQDTDT
ncbi:hypothetical protein PUNSTDRAFT_133945 [Punctularia strigosozonata HHB-11173 SS5]|uniref:uncharacterized protein n=1 Tax=Punctularia strigosozonata (strain HHB-11173) TaxID=741275 RepID=UPI0004417F37|nr:uncharacterized protein PUNSTDRAFT_133945 [Punctularia strigosozonata HHB-11173 SS5]EIN08764.1 hypothetical protein PUNSTDRAFT_133945 [Punctularia strigosozonata HHB-11173 SS5]